MVFKSEKELERTESFNAVFSSGIKPILRDVKKKKKSQESLSTHKIK